MLRFVFAVICVGVAGVSGALEFETPTAITNVTVTQRPGRVIEDATILIENGRVSTVGVAITIPQNAERIDGTGLHAYAGFIDAASHLGMPEGGPDKEDLDRVKDVEQKVKDGPRTSMQQANRLGVWPHVGPADLYKPDEKKTEAYRKAGFTNALITPYPDIISGQGDMVQLSGRPLRSATVARGLTQAVGFGNFSGVSYGQSRTYPASPMGAVALLRQTYLDAEWYRANHALFSQHPTRIERPVHDPVLESMGKLLDREQIWLFKANTANEIHHALDLAQELNQRIAILGGKDAWKLKERIARERVPVIVSLDWDDKPRLAPKKPKKEVVATTATWSPAWENDFYEPLAVRRERIREWEEAVNNAHVLMEAGVSVALTSRDLEKTADLMKNARTALESNLTIDELLAALTTGPASILGLDDQLGTVEPGKLANLVLLTEPLEEKKAQVRHVFIDGDAHTFAIDVAKKDDDEAESDDAEDSDEADDDDTTDSEEDEADSEEDPEDVHPWKSETLADRSKPMETDGNILIQNAHVITVSGGVLHDADVRVRNGKITEIGSNLVAPEGVTVVDLEGYWVMPGIIDPHSHLAVTGINEWTQSITSEVRQADVVNHTQLGIHRAVAGGVTTIHTMHGSANSMGGQNAVLKLKYNTSPREMLVTTGPRLVKFALGENVTRARPIPRYPNSRMGVESVMRLGFNAALEYQKEWKDYEDALANGEVVAKPRRDLRLTALSDILAGDIWVHTHCYRADEMLRLLAVAEDFGIRISTLQHVLEGYRVAPEMYNHGVGGSTFADWWSYKKEAFDAIPYNASMMMRAGIVTSLNSDSSEVIRHLNLEAAKMMRFGELTADEAIRLITINPAIQIGLDSRVGSIEVGKDGDFAVFNAHPLDTAARCIMTIIEGETFFMKEGLTVDGTKPGPNNADIPQPPRTPLDLPFGQAGTYAIVGATVHPVSAPSVPNGTLLIADGRIAAVGNDVSIPRGATQIDGKGLHVYPGLINSATQLGLSEISGLAQTVDGRELALFQPDLRTLSAVNPHSKHIAVALCEGTTTTHVIPMGGIVSGRSGIIQLSGWTMPEMMRSPETGLVVDLPSLPLAIKEDQREKRLEAHRKLMESAEEFFRKAKHYAEISKLDDSDTVRDLRLEAMIPYVRRENPEPIFFRADSYKAILGALNFAEHFNLKPIILGGGEAWKCAEQLAEADVPVIITAVFDTPNIYPYDPYDAFYGNAARLEAAGVTFAIATDGVEFTRQLPVHAGYSVAYGLSEEGALKSITLDAAKILGVDDELGSLEAGKVADVIITTGSPLQASTRTIGTFLKGVPIELTSLHEEHHQRFTNRPEPNLQPVDGLAGPPPMRVNTFSATD